MLSQSLGPKNTTKEPSNVMMHSSKNKESPTNHSSISHSELTYMGFRWVVSLDWTLELICM